MDAINQFAQTHPIQYGSVIKKIERELRGTNPFDHKQINVIQGQTQCGKTEVTFLIASCLVKIGYAVFIMTKNSASLRDQFKQRARTYPNFRGQSIIDYKEAKTQSFKENTIYLYIYQDINHNHLNNTIAEILGHKKVAIIFDEFHIITSMFNDFITNDGFKKQISGSDQLMICRKQNVLTFGIDATPYEFRDAKDLLDSNPTFNLKTRLLSLPPEPNEHQSYISLLGTARHQYTDGNYVNDPINYRMSKTGNSKYGNKIVMPVVIYYDKITTDSHDMTATAIRTKYPEFLVVVINKDYPADINGTYMEALSKGYKGIVFIGHICLTEGLSFRSHDIPKVEQSPHIIFGPTDIVFFEGISLNSKLEEIVQVIGRATGYVPIDYQPDVCVWYSPKSTSYFQEGGYLDKWFIAYSNIDNKPVYSPPVLSEQEEPVISPTPTPFHKSVVSKITIRMYKASVSTPNPGWTQIKLRCQKFVPDDKFKKSLIKDFYSNKPKQGEFQRSFDSENIYPWYGNDRAVLREYFLKPSDGSEGVNDDSEYTDETECRTPHPRRSKTYNKGKGIIIPHPRFIPENGRFKDIDSTNLTWSDCIKIDDIDPEHYISEDNPVGYFIYDEYMFHFALKGQMAAKYSKAHGSTFAESDISIKLMDKFIHSLPYKKINIPKLISLVRELVKPSHQQNFDGITSKANKRGVNCKGSGDGCLFHRWTTALVPLKERTDGCVSDLKQYNPIFSDMFDSVQPQILKPPAPQIVQLPKPQILKPPAPQIVQLPKPQILKPPAPPIVQLPKPQILKPPAHPIVQLPKPPIVQQHQISDQRNHSEQSQKLEKIVALNSSKVGDKLTFIIDQSRIDCLDNIRDKHQAIEKEFGPRGNVDMIVYLNKIIDDYL